MFTNHHSRRRSIKTKILGILIFGLLLSLMAYLSIFYYTTAHVKKMTQDILSEFHDFDKKADVELKNHIVHTFILADLQTYSEYIDKNVQEKISGSTGETNPGDVIAERITIHLKQVMAVDTYKPGYLFAIDEQGKVLATQGPKDESLCSAYIETGQSLLESKNGQLAETVTSVIQSDQTSGIFKGSIGHTPFFFLFSKITSAHCILVELLPEEYLNNQLEVMEEETSVYMMTINKKFISFYNRINYITLAVFIVILVISYIIGSFLAKTLTEPLTKLKKATQSLGEGYLADKVEIRTGDEIEELADNFNQMITSQDNYLDKLCDSIWRKQAIESEIKLAAHIQKSSLPEGMPSFKPGAGVDLSAFIQPTKIVSGDFYDYFFVDDQHLFFALGDVSGKSISAALFMMTTKLLMKKFALMKLPPEDVLKNVNDTLALDNSTCMYCTIFCGILNTKTGHLNCCNAGHTYPLMFNGTSFNYIDTEANMLVGLTSKAEFNSETHEMKENDMLFLYSDGVTESKSASDELYSEPRLMEKLNACSKETSGSVVANIKEDVLAFSENAEQYDDITMLCLAYRRERIDS